MRKAAIYILHVMKEQYIHPFRMELTLIHIKESKSLTDLSQCFCLKLKSLEYALGRESDHSIKSSIRITVAIDVGGVTEDKYNFGHGSTRRFVKCHV